MGHVRFKDVRCKPGFYHGRHVNMYEVCCMQGLDVSSLNVAGGVREWNPLPPAPAGNYSAKAARCWQGPCLNLCCTVDGSGGCITNLEAGGGHYKPGALPSLFFPVPCCF